MYSKHFEKGTLRVAFETYEQVTNDAGFKRMVEQYAATSLNLLDAPVPNMEAYRDSVGKDLFVIVARDAGGVLAGIAVIRVLTSHHHTRRLGTTESLFAVPGFPGAGQALLAALDWAAAELGLQGMGISLPVTDRSPAKRVMMRRAGYTHIHETYFKPCKT